MRSKDELRIIMNESLCLRMGLEYEQLAILLSKIDQLGSQYGLDGIDNVRDILHETAYIENMTKEQLQAKIYNL